MEHEIAQLEKRLEDHINQHMTDYRKLLFWIITTLFALLSASMGFWMKYGSLETQVQNNTTEINTVRNSFVTTKDLTAATALFDAKLNTIQQNQLVTQTAIEEIRRVLIAK